MFTGIVACGQQKFLTQVTKFHQIFKYTAKIHQTKQIIQLYLVDMQIM